ncbi:MAG: zinc-binding alcohol dehydrogenase family protein [Rhodanobacter sp.]
MKSLRILTFGTPENLQIQQVEKPVADSEHAVVQVFAAPINPSDVKNAAGLMSQTTLPRTPGRDFAGVVVDGPAQWLGKEVWGSGGRFGFTHDGSHAEYLKVPLGGLSLKPVSLDFVAAASVGVPFTIAWLGLVDYARASAGETVVVIGASGSVGQAVCQLARWRGCRVIGVVREAPSAAQAACFDAWALSDQQLPARIREMTCGNGADVVYDAVGGVMFAPALQCVAHRGRLIEISATGAVDVVFNLRDFYHNETQLFGADSLKLDAGDTARLLDRLAPLFDDGRLHSPGVQRIVSLDHAIEAYQQVASGKGGRQVIVPERAQMYSAKN